MVSKVFLATLVISLAYLSEAVFFKDRFPGKTLADLAECQDGYRLVGMRETKPTTKFAPKNGKQCAKYCLKQLLAGERKDNDNKNIVGSLFKASQCYCARYNSPRFVEEAGTFSCVFDPPAVCDMNALNKAEGLEIVGCTDPNNPAGRPNLPGSTCTYTCKDGYEITGADSIKCGSDGKWSGSVPICEEKIIECAEVDEVANAKPMDCTSGTTMISQSCTLECEDGYELVGNNEITCDIVDGQGVFDGTFGECKGKESKEEGLIPGKTCWKEGEQFMGTTVYTTASGKTCDNWDWDFNAWHMYDDNGDYDRAMYDAASNDLTDDTAGNYCRNYKEDPNGPYCFVGATKADYDFVFEDISRNGNILSSQDHFEYCDIPKCP